MYAELMVWLDKVKKDRELKISKMRRVVEKERKRGIENE